MSAAKPGRVAAFVTTAAYLGYLAYSAWVQAGKPALTPRILHAVARGSQRSAAYLGSLGLEAEKAYLHAVDQNSLRS